MRRILSLVQFSPFHWHDILDGLGYECLESVINNCSGTKDAFAEYAHSELVRITTNADNTDSNIGMITLVGSFCTYTDTYTSTDGTISKRFGIYIWYDNQPLIGNTPNTSYTLIKNALGYEIFNLDEALLLVLNRFVIVHAPIGTLALMISALANEPQHNMHLHPKVEYTSAIDNGNAHIMHQLDNNRNIDNNDHSNSYDVSVAALYNQKIDYTLKERVHPNTVTTNMSRIVTYN